MDILCGPDEWKEEPSYESTDTDSPILSLHCQKICRFSNSTYATLLSFYEPEEEEGYDRFSNAEDDDYDEEEETNQRRMKKSLGEALKESLKSDALYPGVQYLVYQVYGTYPKVQFHPNDFFWGIDFRLDKLMQHVHSCMQKHGSNKVLL